MDATDYKFATHAWPPPDDRQDRRFYLFGFDQDNQPFIVRWCDSDAWKGWRAITLRTVETDSAQPWVHADGGDDWPVKRWADAPLLWSVLEAGIQKAVD